MVRDMSSSSVYAENTDAGFSMSRNTFLDGRIPLLTPDGDGTRVRFTLDLEPTGLMRLMSGAIQKTMTAEVGQLSTLKSVLES